jgi:hypothetical protein
MGKHGQVLKRLDIQNDDIIYVTNRKFTYEFQKWLCD